VVSLNRIREFVRGKRGGKQLIAVLLLLMIGVLGLGIGTINESLDGDFPGILPDDSDPPDVDVRTPTQTPPPGENTPTPGGQAAQGPAGDGGSGESSSGGPSADSSSETAPDSSSSSTDTPTATDTPTDADYEDGDGSDGGDGYDGGDASEEGWDSVDLEIVNDTAQIQIADVLPGDNASQVVVVENNGSDPGRISAVVRNVTDSENGHTEPEAAVDNAPGGELSSELLVRLSVELSDGTTATLTNGYVDLTAIEDESKTVDPSAPNLTSGENATLELDLKIPRDAGNEIQTDGVTFDVAIGLKDATS
jgi:hypothetical protein